MHSLEKQIKKYHHNLDFTQVLERKGINWNRGGGKPCNKILNDIFNHQKSWKTGNNEWIEISQESGFSIKKRYDITKYTTRLEDEGLIEITRTCLYGTYGTKCYSYKFQDQFYRNELPSIRKNKCILQKRTKSKTSENRNKLEDDELYKIIKSNSEKLFIDYEKLEKEIDIENGEVMAAVSFICSDFVKEEGHHIYDDVNGRIYSPWIETAKEFRPFIKNKDGKVLVDIDIKSSHPTLLLSLYDKLDYKKFRDNNKAAKEAWNGYKASRDIQQGGDGMAPIGRIPEQEKERLKYKKVLQGDIYTFLQKEVNSKIKHKDYGRDDIKPMFSAFLNSSSWLDEETLSHLSFRTKHNKINEVGKAFIKEFPCLFDLMKIAATKDQSEILSKKGEPCIGIGLMKMESNLMRPVLEELAKKNLFFIPCHDGVLVEEDAARLAENKILSSIKSLGIQPDESMVKVNYT